MPLTAFQKDVLAVLAANRSEESHFAGGVLLHGSDDSPRYSRDFDIFHDVALEVARASERDVVSLRDAGFTVDTLSRHDEWERDATFRRALVRGAAGHLDFRLVADGQPPGLQHSWIQRASLNLVELHRIDAREAAHHLQQRQGREAGVLAARRPADRRQLGRPAARFSSISFSSVTAWHVRPNSGMATVNGSRSA